MVDPASRGRLADITPYTLTIELGFETSGTDQGIHSHQTSHPSDVPAATKDISHLVVRRDRRVAFDILGAFEVRQGYHVILPAVENIVHSRVIKTDGKLSQSMNTPKATSLNTGSFYHRQSIPHTIKLYPVSML